MAARRFSVGVVSVLDIDCDFFANVFGDSQDVFVHVDVLRRSGLANLMAGEAIGVRVVEGGGGPMGEPENGG